MADYKEMTKAEFAAALKRNGFRAVGFLGYYKSDELPDVSLPSILMMSRSGYRIARRATIAHLIKQRDEYLAKQEAA
jgi:hypothetical protein